MHDDDTTVQRATRALQYMGRRMVGIESDMAATSPCCDAVDVDERHACMHICPIAGAQANQHQTLLHTIARALNQAAWDPPPSLQQWWGALHRVSTPQGGRIRHQEWRSSGGTDPGVPLQGHPILDLPDADPQAQVHLRGSSADREADQLPLPPRRGNAGTRVGVSG